MLKKILIGVGVLAIIAIAIFSFIGYQTVKTVDEKLKTHEPEFREYVTMTADQQNAYVEKNLELLLGTMIQDADDDKKRELFKKIQSDPDAKSAGIEFGRAIVAKVIMSTEEITKDLKDDAKNKLQSEADKFTERLEKYSDVLKKYDPELEK